MSEPMIDAGVRQRVAAAQCGRIGPHRFVVVCMLLAAVLLAGCRPPESMAYDELPDEPVAYESIEALDVAHDFMLPKLDGGVVRLSELRGQWVLVNFWATWCAPCRAEMPYLEHLASEHASDLTVLAVNMREPPAVVASFVAELGLDLPILLQPDDATLLAYDVRGLPVSVLIDPDGMVALRAVGPLVEGVVETVLPLRCWQRVQDRWNNVPTHICYACAGDTS